MHYTDRVSLACCLLFAACGGPAGLAGPCDPDLAGQCEGTLVCDTGDSTCRNPIGGSCDSAGAERQCIGDAQCVGEGASAACGLIEGSTCDPTDNQCGGNLICVPTATTHLCALPLILAGTVTDIAGTVIAGAHIIVLDQQQTPISDVAVSDTTGAYAIEVPATRDSAAAPVSATFTLRASASGYQTFPGGLRNALPIDAATATKEDSHWSLNTALTQIALIDLPSALQGLPHIAGKVIATSGAGGVLVVAESTTGGISALTDAGGNFTIFNVPDGDYTIRGYRAAVQLIPVDRTMNGVDITGVDLSASTDSLATVSGSIQIVATGGGSMTSVVLAIAASFDAIAVRGEVPPGLRTPLDITGAWSLSDVPDGRYFVLAALEDDGLVRDPDANIAGTAIVEVTVPDPTGGRTIILSNALKVTAALDVVSPGASGPDAITGTPTFVWADDQSEEYYVVEVFDALGNLTWTSPDLPPVSGGANASVVYGGAALEIGMYYQFRATSWRAPGGNASPISTTEDLKGVFYIE